MVCAIVLPFAAIRSARPPGHIPVVGPSIAQSPAVQTAVPGKRGGDQPRRTRGGKRGTVVGRVHGRTAGVSADDRGCADAAAGTMALMRAKPREVAAEVITQRGIEAAEDRSGEQPPALSDSRRCRLRLWPRTASSGSRRSD
jgi:hypothetical protein